MTKWIAFACLLLAAPALAGPTPQPPTAPVPVAPAASRAMYRLDFELTTTEPGKPAATIAFSLNLDEHRVGEVTLGDNVAVGGARQNVGLRVSASYELAGGDLLLTVNTELSTLVSPSATHRIQTQGMALATPGKQTLVASLDHDHAHTQVSVTATKL
jgi:hypothetical protein